MGWIFAADSARITDEKASAEDRKHTSGGVFVHKHGWMFEEVCESFPKDSGTRKVGHEKSPWLTASDANMSPENFKKSLWFRSRHMFIKAPGEGVSTCRSESPNGELIERTFDYVIASHRLFLVERDKEFKMWREQKMPEALPGFSGGNLQKNMENEVIRGIIAGVPKEADTVGVGVTRNTVSAALSTNAGEDSFKKLELGVGRNVDGKRIEQCRCFGMV